MSGLMGGGGDITTTEARVAGLRVQTSSRGVPITIVFGRNRVTPNLLWFDDFETIENKTTEQVGKGGGTTVTNVTYTYRASVLMGLCAGPIVGVTTVWRHKDKHGATSRSLPAEQLSHGEILPAGKVITVPQAARWHSTVSVTDDSYGPVTDYTVAAGVYTFGASVSVGTSLLIVYNIGILIEYFTPLEGAGFTHLATGTLGQAQWGFLTAAHPTEGLAYSGLAVVAASQFLLGAAAGLPQINFEVDGPRQFGGGIFDANPADIVTDLLTGVPYGAGFPAGQLNAMAQLRAWANAAGLWFSPVYTERKGVFEYIEQLANLSYARVLWSVNTLKIIPLATEPLSSGTGVFTPLPEHGGPVYLLNDDDFATPVEETRAAPADRFNRISLRYRSRDTDYAEAVESAEDRAAIDTFGLIEAPEVVSATEIAAPNVAAMVVELLLRDTLQRAGSYKFALPINYDLLEPLDIVQIEDERIGLPPTTVRIVEISENGDSGALLVHAEDVRTAGGVTQARQAGGGYAYGTGAPDAVTVRTVMVPTALTANAQELWVGVSAGANWGGSEVWISSSGVDYRRVGALGVRSRLGTLATTLASASVELNPAQTFDVNVVGQAQMAGATQIDADAGRSLVWVNGELLAYRDATLVSAGRYTLGYLLRGLYSTARAAQSIGAPWMRMDETPLRLPIAPADIGKTIYLKITSRNALGTYVQSLAEVASIPVLLAAATSPPADVPNLALTSAFLGTYFEVSWQAAARATDYEVEVRTPGGSLLRTAYTSAQVFRYTVGDASDDGGALRAYDVKVRGRNTAGDGNFATLAVANAAPAATTGVGQTGSGTSRTISWSAGAESDLAGYKARYSTTNGFDPAASAGTEFYDGTGISTLLSGLTVSTVYYVRVAAYDVWSNTNADLNWSAQLSFTA